MARSQLAALDDRKRILDTRHNRRDLVAKIRHHALEQIADEQFVLDDEDTAPGLACGHSGHAARTLPTAGRLNCHPPELGRWVAAKTLNNE